MDPLDELRRLVTAQFCAAGYSSVQAGLQVGVRASERVVFVRWEDGPSEAAVAEVVRARGHEVVLERHLSTEGRTALVAYAVETGTSLAEIEEEIGAVERRVAAARTSAADTHTSTEHTSPTLEDRIHQQLMCRVGTARVCGVLEQVEDAAVRELWGDAGRGSVELGDERLTRARELARTSIATCSATDAGTLRSVLPGAVLSRVQAVLGLQRARDVLAAV